MNDSVYASVSTGTGNIVVAPSTVGAITAGDDLLSTSDGTNDNGPLTVTTGSPVYGEGAYVEGPGGEFTVNIEAFAGFNSVLDTSVTSDTAGDPVFVGVSDSAQEITSVVYSLTSVGTGASLGNFALDTMYLQDRYIVQAPPVVAPPPASTPQAQTDNTAPEPGMMPLLGVALLTFGIMLKKRSLLSLKSLS